MFFTLGALYLGAAVYLDRRGLREPPYEAFDAIVVLGCRVFEDGRPSLSLRRRTERAVALWRRGLAPTIVLTGGHGAAPISEAAAAAAIARALGVPDDALVLEERSTTTEQNAREAATVVDAARVLVVTDSYHVLRAERVFGRHFTRAVGAGCRGPARARARGALREVIALTAYAMRGRL